MEPHGARGFAKGMEELLVVEEKRPLMEEQLARILYDLEPRPRLAAPACEAVIIHKQADEITPASPLLPARQAGPDMNQESGTWCSITPRNGYAPARLTRRRAIPDKPITK